MLAHVVLGAALIGSATAGSPRTLFRASDSGTSLRGLTSVPVSVRYNGPPEAPYGLSESELAEDVALALKAGGLRTPRAERGAPATSRPYLFAHIVGDTVGGKGRDGLLFYTVTLELIQNVALGRNPRLRCEGVTWSEGTTVVLPRARLRTVAEQLESLASDFSLAVQQANSGVRVNPQHRD
ncbi:MAG TPA: hypothetical protein VMM80_04515 [Bacteroidota bacterium]|nr:hypothetical protein [Bacteroidota bacterium]